MFISFSVSIIIPNYNHAPYLKQRIDSVLNQTFQDFELIILDDDSTDESRSIIEQYRNHPKISHIIYNEQNSGGVFKQWIKGIELARGKYIWIAESDDYSAHNFLEETVVVLEQDTNIGLVFTDSNTVDSRGNHLTTTAASKSEVYQRLELSNNMITKENLPLFLVKELVIENVSCVLLRTDSLKKVDFAELTEFRNTGDRFTYIGIALNDNLLYLPKTLNFMRSHGQNTTSKNYQNGIIHQDRLHVLNYYFEDFFKKSIRFKEIGDFYKENYFHFINHCSANENLKLLENINKTRIISTLFYVLVKFYIVLFKKLNLKSRILRGIYYRILLQLK